MPKNEPLQILEDILDHLAHGKMTLSGLQRLARIRNAFPEGHPDCQGAIWRAVLVDPDQKDHLLAGQVVELDPRSCDCWAPNQSDVMHVARLRIEQAKVAGSAIALLRKEIPAELWRLDLKEAYRSLGGPEDDHRWIRYLDIENEILVENEGGRSLLKPEDLEGVLDIQECFLPVVGERFWNFEVDGYVSIEKVIGPTEEGDVEVIASGRRCAVYPEYGSFSYRELCEPDELEMS